MAEFTERQARDWEQHAVPILKRHGVNPDLRGHDWSHRWNESRPGRGHSMNSTYCDGEVFAQVLMDVYGSPSVSVATLDWVHADSNEEWICEDCPDPDAALAGDTPEGDTP